MNRNYVSLQKRDGYSNWSFIQEDREPRRKEGTSAAVWTKASRKGGEGLTVLMVHRSEEKRKKGNVQRVSSLCQTLCYVPYIHYIILSYS